MWWRVWTLTTSFAAIWIAHILLPARASLHHVADCKHATRDESLVRGEHLGADSCRCTGRDRGQIPGQCMLLENLVLLGEHMCTLKPTADTRSRQQGRKNRPIRLTDEPKRKGVPMRQRHTKGAQQ
jgi:hypothetical protein